MTTKYKAVGVHVFAGGFSMGVKRVMDVHAQLERGAFGRETVEQVVGLPFVMADDKNTRSWPRISGQDAQLCYGNPRCTGFSTITSGYDETTHGPWAKQTCDIHELCEYAAGHYDVVVWESVQQAYKVGKPLVDHLVREHFRPRGYRIAHLFLNAASFGNMQMRRRYFFVAYRDDRNFNVTPPVITTRMPTTWDAIGHLRDRETHECETMGANIEYDFDSYVRLVPEEKDMVKRLWNSWNPNMIGRWVPDLLPEKWQRTWENRISDMPFSMHTIHRIGWLSPFPTIHSSTSRAIHPELDRPLTIGELATGMGWDDIPRGRDPVPQIAKGIVPGVGEWLARQAVDYLDDAWGSEDFESTYDPVRCEWVGGDSTGKLEKTFDLTSYVGTQLDPSEYPVAHHPRPYRWQDHHDVRLRAKDRNYVTQ